MAQKSKEKILEAATGLFAEMGRYGTPMEKIAEVAGVNKAMVYYYFSDRENLYREVFKQLLTGLFAAVIPEVKKAALEEDDPNERVKRISKAYSKNFAGNRNYIRIILEAVTGLEPEFIADVIRENQREGRMFRLETMEPILKNAFGSDNFREIEPLQFLNILVSVHLGFFVLRPIFSTITGLDEDAQEQFLRKRDELVPDLLLHGIVERKKEK